MPRKRKSDYQQFTDRLIAGGWYKKNPEGDFTFRGGPVRSNTMELPRVIDPKTGKRLKKRSGSRR